VSNYRRANVSGGCYFFTLVTYRWQRFLIDEPARQILRESIIKTRQIYPFAINAWVLLPDHLHCIWTLPENDNNFSIRWNLIKKHFSQKAKPLYHRDEWLNPSKIKHRETTIWQRRFWEHTIRNDDDYAKHMDYIHYNPVKHGYVTRVADWCFSSFHRYVACGVYALDWGGDKRTLHLDFE